MAALPGGIEVSVDISKKVNPPAARLSGSQVLIATEDLIILFLELFTLSSNLLITFEVLSQNPIKYF